jgi:aminopeptidase N
MAWWDDLWLNEGFASWMESKATAHFNPEWQSALDRVNGREGAMGLDAYVTTHPVIQKISTVEQTSQAFDTITYSKGEAVITMLEAFAGETVWRDGLRAYMKKHAYANTRTDDLWNAVEAAGAKGLVRIAHDFTRQPGVPLISVNAAKCVNGSTVLSLSQSEFSRDRKAETTAKPQRWNVPVIAQVVGNATGTGIGRGYRRRAVGGVTRRAFAFCTRPLMAFLGAQTRQQRPEANLWRISTVGPRDLVDAVPASQQAIK